MADTEKIVERLFGSAGGETAIRHRSGLVTAVPAAGFVDVERVGNGIPVLAGQRLSVGDVAHCMVWSGGAIAIGRTGVEIKPPVEFLPGDGGSSGSVTLEWDPGEFERIDFEVRANINGNGFCRSRLGREGAGIITDNVYRFAAEASNADGTTLLYPGLGQDTFWHGFYLRSSAGMFRGTLRVATTPFISAESFGTSGGGAASNARSHMTGWFGSGLATPLDRIQFYPPAGLTFSAVAVHGWGYRA